METLLINEQLIYQFKYWREGQIRTGMRFRQGLFEYVSQFNQWQRYQAFELAWQLTQANREVIMTASLNQYTIWANLRIGDKAVAMAQPKPALTRGAFNRIPELALHQTALSA